MNPDEPQVLKIVPDMIDNMKTTVVMFMGSQMLLAFLGVIWGMLTFDEPIFRLIGPIALFVYSITSLWIVSHTYKIFKTKLAVLN